MAHRCLNPIDPSPYIGAVYSRSQRFPAPSAPSLAFSVVRFLRFARFSAAFNLRDISRCCRIDDDCLCPPIILPSHSLRSIA
jgi:hypothetical protein